MEKVVGEMGMHSRWVRHQEAVSRSHASGQVDPGSALAVVTPAATAHSPAPTPSPKPSSPPESTQYSSDKQTTQTPAPIARSDRAATENTTAAAASRQDSSTRTLAAPRSSPF